MDPPLSLLNHHSRVQHRSASAASKRLQVAEFPATVMGMPRKQGRIGTRFSG